MTEKEIENQILEYLSVIPGHFWKNQSTGLYDPTKRRFRKNNNKYHINGVSDILGILPNGIFVAIEVKTPKGRLTDSQKTFLKEITLNGGIAFVARSVKDVVDQLNQFLQ